MFACYDLSPVCVSLSFVSQLNILLLRELSARDISLEIHKYNTFKLSQMLAGGKFSRYSSRLSGCANELCFVSSASGDLKLRQQFRLVGRGRKIPIIQFCRVRVCPVCQSRRSLLWKARARKVLLSIIEDFPYSSFALLTLTVENCPLLDLRFTINQMNRSWSDMSRPGRVVYSPSGSVVRTEGNPLWPALGWVKSLEVSRSKTNEAHPHFHILLLLPPNYFRSNLYLSTARWVDMWRSYLRSDYSPIVDIRKVYDPYTAVPEVFKYVTKETDLLTDSCWLTEYIEQVHGLRFISSGGALADYFKFEDETNDELINLDEELPDIDCPSETPILRFSWAADNVVGHWVYNYRYLDNC